ncbi:MAG: diaminopimelate epimerase [Acuticoccus sp.]
MIPFRKMNGLGNDFVVVDARHERVDLPQARIAALADRQSGIGFDQFIVIAPAEGGDAAARMRIFNADGGEVESCGNAARCVAGLLLAETGTPEVAIESTGGPMLARRQGDLIAVDMGVPHFAGAAIPLAEGTGDPQALTVPGFEGYGAAACVNVGNPHVVFVVPDVAAVPLARDGAALERHTFFPERANISFVEILNRQTIRARVWERGVGATKACGTAACAIGALAARLDWAEPRVTVELPGGPLAIDVSNGRIIMAGPYALDFLGTIEADGFRVASPQAAAP